MRVYALLSPFNGEVIDLKLCDCTLVDARDRWPEYTVVREEDVPQDVLDRFHDWEAKEA